MRNKRRDESWGRYILSMLLEAVIYFIIFIILGIFGEGVKLWAAKLVYKFFGKKTKPYMEWEKEQEEEKRKKEREEREKQKALEKKKEGNVPPAKALTQEEADAIPEREWLIDGWLFNNDLAVLFGPPKAGKSTLAMQIARDLAEGRTSEVFPMDCARQKQWVLYYHLEMTAEEVKADCPDLLPAPNISYLIQPEGIETPQSLVDDIRKQIEMIKVQAFTVIVDNISKIGNATTDDKLLRLLASLYREMKKKYRKDLTILLLNHTDGDKYKEYAPLDSPMMRGSQNVWRQAGLLFSINNTCEGENIKMIKMNDRRNAKREPDVIVVERYQTPQGRGQFRYVRKDAEEELLQTKFTPRKAGIHNQAEGGEEAKPTRGRNLKLTIEQKQRIVEIYHNCAGNLNAAARAIQGSGEELLREIEKFTPTQVSRIVGKYEKSKKQA